MKTQSEFESFIANNLEKLAATAWYGYKESSEKGVLFADIDTRHKDANGEHPLLLFFVKWGDMEKYQDAHHFNDERMRYLKKKCADYDPATSFVICAGVHTGTDSWATRVTSPEMTPKLAYQKLWAYIDNHVMYQGEKPKWNDI